jgi:hypothetical protein
MVLTKTGRREAQMERQGRSMIRRTVLAAATVAALALSGAPAAQAGEFHGVVSQGPLQSSDYTLMNNANVGTLRIPVRWANPNWDGLDALVHRAAINGIRVLPILDGPSPFGGAPTSKAERRSFASFAAQVANRYGRGGSFWATLGFSVPITAYQIYNEQNGRAYWDGRPNPRAYGKLLRGASKAINRQDRRAEIVLGGMFATPSGRGSITSWAYLNKLYKVRGVKRAFDTVAVHPYSKSLRGIKYVIGKARRVMRKNRDRAKLRITEFGWGSARRGGPFNVGRRGQARMLRKAFRLFEGNRRAWKLKGVNWFAFQDAATGCYFCPSSGLVEADRDTKPSYRAFKRAARR